MANSADSEFSGVHESEHVETSVSITANLCQDEQQQTVNPVDAVEDVYTSLTSPRLSNDMLYEFDPQANRPSFLPKAEPAIACEYDGPEVYNLAVDDSDCEESDVATGEAWYTSEHRPQASTEPRAAHVDDGLTLGNASANAHGLGSRVQLLLITPIPASANRSRDTNVPYVRRTAWLSNGLWGEKAERHEVVFDRHPYHISFIGCRAVMRNTFVEVQTLASASEQAPIRSLSVPNSLR